MWRSSSRRASSRATRSTASKRRRAKAARGGAANLRPSPLILRASKPAGRPSPPARSGRHGHERRREWPGDGRGVARPRRGRAALGVGMSEDANARVGRGAASGRRSRARAAEERGGGQGPTRAAARAGVPYGKTALELRASATMGGADNFAQKSISGLIPFPLKGDRLQD